MKNGIVPNATLIYLNGPSSKIARKENNGNSMKISFRGPKESDLKALHKFVNELSRERTFVMRHGEKVSMKEEREWLRGILKSIRKRECVFLIAEVDGEFAGSAQIVKSKFAMSHVGVFGISVAKKFRGLGVGKKLMEGIHALARKELRDIKILRLAVFVDNTLARKMYKKFCYKEYGLLPKGVRHGTKYV